MADEDETGKTAEAAGKSPSSDAHAGSASETPLGEPASGAKIAPHEAHVAPPAPETSAEREIGAAPPPYSPSSPPPHSSSSDLPKPQSEWTASDERGPLAAAGSDEASVSVEDASPAAPTGTGAAAVSSRDTSAASAAVAEPRSSWPIAAGILFGAVIGAVVALLVYRTETSDSAPDQQVVALAAKVDALDHRPDPSAEIAKLKQDVAALQKTAGAAPKPAASVAAPKEAAAPAFDPAPLQRQIAALQASLDGLKQQGTETKGLAGKLDDLSGKLAALQKQAATNESGLQTIQGAQKNLEGKVGAPALAVVADSLVQQIDQGQPYAAQVDALVSLSADPVKIAILKQNAAAGVPSAKILAAKFAPLTEPILATAHKAPPNAGFLERLQAGMSSLVSVRRADDVSGTDLASSVARLQADLAHDDVAGALAAWNALPADAKAKSETWAASAKTSAEAMTAARGLQADSIAAMGGKKS